MKHLIKIFFGLFLYSCSSQLDLTNIIKIKGSDTMLLLNRKLAEEFMKINPDISIYVEGGGTATGVNSLIDNKIDICSASRPLEPDEIKQFGENFSTVGMSYLIGRDALSIYINKGNPIKKFTLEQLSDIFLCKITNWKDYGGDDIPILPISRSTSSGTHIYFQKHVLKGEEICNSIQVANTTAEIVKFVKENKNAIGYGGIGYADYSMQAVINEIHPTKENVLNNSYPISRYLRYYTSRKPSGNTKKYIDWVVSLQGQKIVEEMGYIPLWN
ncbi:MAG: phosphate ABC transporter substrate-binding protein [Ignavibacteriales bacterium]|nr:phosphate ABC transporter substrate-binding protein [Ignavibacteriales bacterium]